MAGTRDGDAVEPRPERSTAVLLRDVRPEDLDEFFLHQQDEQANLMSAFAPRNPRDRGVFDYHWAHLLGDEDTVVRTIEHEGRAVVRSCAPSRTAWASCPSGPRRTTGAWA